MRVIEIPYQNKWINLWLELNSAMVVDAFESLASLP